MKVAINTRFLLKDKLEGFGWFTYHVSKYLAENNPDIQFYFLFDRPYDEEFVFSKNVRPVVLKPQARHPLLFRIWFDFSVTRFLRKEEIDLFFSPDGYLSLRTSCPQIAVIHDLNFEHYPEDLKPHHARYLRKFFPKFAQKAERIITVSEFSKNDIIETYGVQPDKIRVAYNGVHEVFNAKVENEQSDFPYFLFVGSIHPRKNLKRLLEAFDIFKTSAPSSHRLMIVGEPYYWSEEMKLALSSMKFRDDVIFHSYASVEQLKTLYQRATALFFISYFEGFGIPVVEAMACGCPVVVSAKTACAEVAGGAALEVDGFSIDAIVQAMIDVSQSDDVRKSLREKGFARSVNFSWDITGEIVHEEMNKLLNSRV